MSIPTIHINAASAELPVPTAKKTSLDGQFETFVDVWVSPDGSVETGVWECSAGTFTATRDGYDEVCTIVTGTATVTDVDGTVTELSPGSVFVTPAGWSGTWVLHTSMRKTYVIRNHAD